jgi:hypothetical protein
LKDLLPFSGPLPKDHLLVVMKSYFDGGNQADSRQYDVVTLASISGTSDQWRLAERDWKAILKKHHAPFLHTTDAVSLTSPPLTKNDGWDKTKRDAFISDCVTVIENHLALPIKGAFQGKLGLYPFTVSVVLDDFKKARQTNSSVPRDANEICAVQTLGGCLSWGMRHQRPHFYHLFFDQGEPFRGHIVDRQTNPKSAKIIPLMDRIIMKGEVDMRHVPALQMADLFAWCVSHRNKGDMHGWQRRLLNFPRGDEWLDYKELIKPHQSTVGFVKEWKLPRRRATR